MAKPYIIGIAGESGVGKSTIAEVISLFYGIENTTIISTDDLHKWERTNPAWEYITHLNPEANNLELGDIHLSALSRGRSIYRSVYNHKTGYFDPPKKVEPKSVIVIEGLHSFYTEISKNLIDLKIYVDTNEELKTHWKIIRDTEERGYKYNMVLDTIHKRRHDSHKIRGAQVGVSDVVISVCPTDKIKILGDKHEKVDLTVSISSGGSRQELFDFITEYMTSLKDYTKMSEFVGEDLELCQDMGGNVSVKMSHNLMLIKASGTQLKDARLANSYSTIDYAKFTESIIVDDDSLNKIVKESPLLKKHKRPSMETGFHVLLDRYVLHAHPIYLTLILCLENSKEIAKELSPALDFTYIEYVNPGFSIYHKIASSKKSNVYFLENHGIILSSDDMSWCMQTLYELNNKAKDYIRAHCEFQNFDLSFAGNAIDGGYTFPDAFILDDDKEKMETHATHSYILDIGSKVGKLRYLLPDNLHFLRNMEAEKYRKAQ